MVSVWRSGSERKFVVHRGHYFQDYVGSHAAFYVNTGEHCTDVTADFAGAFRLLCAVLQLRHQVPGGTRLKSGLGSKGKVDIKVYKRFLTVAVDFGDSVGLMGSYEIGKLVP
jgi:hypothetical protein